MIVDKKKHSGNISTSKRYPENDDEGENIKKSLVFLIKVKPLKF